MIALIISLFLGAALFLVLRQASVFVSTIKQEGKVYRAIIKDDKKPQGLKNFLLPVIFRLSSFIGIYLSKIKYKKFIDYTEKLDVLFKKIGGKYEHFNGAQFFVLQIFTGACGGIFVLFFISSNLILCLAGALIGFASLYLQLKEEDKKRKNLILKQLPDAVDLLSVMLEAGSDFFSAVGKTAEILQGPLSRAMMQASAKISLGYDRKMALIDMAKFCNVEQVMSFVKTVNMALESGAKMADALKRQSWQIRQEQQMIAEKRAQEAPVKILIPLILFIFPTIFIVIFGPIVINLVQSGGF